MISAIEAATKALSGGLVVTTTGHRSFIGVDSATEMAEAVLDALGAAGYEVKHWTTSRPVGGSERLTSE